MIPSFFRLELPQPIYGVYDSASLFRQFAHRHRRLTHIASAVRGGEYEEGVRDCGFGQPRDRLNRGIGCIRCIVGPLRHTQRVKVRVAAFGVRRDRGSRLGSTQE